MLRTNSPNEEDPAHRRCFKTWVLIASPFFSLYFRFPPSHSNERPPFFNFQSGVGTTLLLTSAHCCSAEEYLLLSLSSAAAVFSSLTPNATTMLHVFLPRQTPTSSLVVIPSRKKAKQEARLLLPLTEVMKSSRLLSQPLGMPRSSSPRLETSLETLDLTLLNLILYQSILPFDCCWNSIVVVFLFSKLFQLLLSQGVGIGFFVSYPRSLFSISQPKALCSRAWGCSSELRQVFFQAKLDGNGHISLLGLMAATIQQR